MYAGQTPSADTWLFMFAALGGAVIGTFVGLHWLSQTMTRGVLAAILGGGRSSTAALKARNTNVIPKGNPSASDFVVIDNNRRRK